MRKCLMPSILVSSLFFSCGDSADQEEETAVDIAVGEAQSLYDQIRASQGRLAANDEVLRFFSEHADIARAELGDYGNSFWLIPEDENQEVVVFVPTPRLEDFAAPTSTISAGLTRQALRFAPEQNRSCIVEGEPPPRQEPEELDTSETRTVTILDSLENPYDIENTGEAWHLSRSRVISTFESVGYSVTVKDSKEFTLEDLIGLGQAGIAVLTAHGTRKYDVPLLFPDVVWSPEANDALGLRACEPSDFEQPTERTFSSCDVIKGQAGGEYYTIVTPRFIETRLQTFSDSLLVLMACHQLANDSQMAQAFLNKGAHTVLGAQERGVLDNWGRLMNVLFERVTEAGWDIEGALARVPHRERTGADRERAPGEEPGPDWSGPCTVATSEDGTNPWAILSEVSVTLEDLPNDTDEIVLTATLDAGGDDAELGSWTLSPGTTNEEIKIPSVSEGVIFKAEVAGEMAEGKILPNNPVESVTLSFEPCDEGATRQLSYVQVDHNMCSAEPGRQAIQTFDFFFFEPVEGAERYTIELEEGDPMDDDIWRYSPWSRSPPFTINIGPSGHYQPPERLRRFYTRDSLVSQLPEMSVVAFPSEDALLWWPDGAGLVCNTEYSAAVLAQHDERNTTRATKYGASKIVARPGVSLAACIYGRALTKLPSSGHRKLCCGRRRLGLDW